MSSACSGLIKDIVVGVGVDVAIVEAASEERGSVVMVEQSASECAAMEWRMLRRLCSSGNICFVV